MKKTVKYFLLLWVAMLAIYNVVTFTVPALPGYEISYDGRFWVSWSLIMVAYLAQMICMVSVLWSNNLEKLFLNIPLLKRNRRAVIWMTLIGSLCMLIPDCPLWIASILCGLIFVRNLVGIVKAGTAAEAVSNIGERTADKTLFIRMLTAKAQTLVSNAKNEEIKAECRKVYEAIRYSDPMSSDALSAAESQITLKFAALSEAVAANDLDAVQAAGQALVELIENRNQMCKLLK